MEDHKVYLLHGGRVFIPAKVGNKWATGLMFKGDGLHTKKVPVTDLVNPALYKGKPYPARKMRGHVRKAKAVGKGAKALRNEVLTAGAV